MGNMTGKAWSLTGDRNVRWSQVVSSVGGNGCEARVGREEGLGR